MAKRGSVRRARNLRHYLRMGSSHSAAYIAGRPPHNKQPSSFGSAHTNILLRQLDILLRHPPTSSFSLLLAERNTSFSLGHRTPRRFRFCSRSASSPSFSILLSEQNTLLSRLTVDASDGIGKLQPFAIISGMNGTNARTSIYP